MSIDKMIIREMMPKDFVTSARIMSGAFAGKMPMMKAFNEEALADFMLAGGVFDAAYLKGHYVTEFHGQVVGIIHLDTWLDKKNKPVAPKKLGYMFKKFGLWRVLLSGFSLLFLDTKLLKDELYVDFIAVDPNYRGQGVGGRMLNYGETIARSTMGVRRYTLSVIDENIGARRLYEGFGFKVCETHQSKVVELFTGIKKSYKLEKFI